MNIFLILFEYCRCLPNKQQGYTGGTFRTVVIANNITLLSKEVTPNITGKDVHECKKFSKQKGSVFDILSKSLAPSIHGHEFVKKVTRTFWAFHHSN